MDFFDINLNENEIRKMSSLGLAHIGDAVFELLVRSKLALLGDATAARLHRDTVKLVAAPAQAKAAEKILASLTDEELAVFRRGRNAKVNSVPKAATLFEYHEATALETLFGYLYLTGRRERINELFCKMTEEDHAS